MSFDLVIFDMDGVLIDSESKYDAAFLRFLSDLRINPGKDRMGSFMGMGGRDIAKTLIELFPETPYSVRELTDLYHRALYLVLLNEVHAPVDGVVALIDLIREAGLKTAIASSSSRAMVSLIADRFELSPRMDLIVTGEDVSRSKPDPEIFLKAADTLGISPGRCLVIEDSKNGITAAKAAGMTVAAFTGAPSAAGPFTCGADFVVPRFHESALEPYLSLGTGALR